nr:MAG TPA: hypothetical protein [Caudoviricetes sp.]
MFHYFIFIVYEMQKNMALTCPANLIGKWSKLLRRC